MDITPTKLGALADVTPEAWTELLETLADDPKAMELLVSMADAKTALNNLQVAAAAGRPVSDERIEEVACEVDGLRDAIAERLSDCRVTVVLTAAGCRKRASELAAAAKAAEERFRTPGQVRLPGQRDRWAAA